MKDKILVMLISVVVGTVISLLITFGLNSYLSSLVLAKNEGAKMAIEAIINTAMQNGSVSFDVNDKNSGEKMIIKLNLEKNNNLTKEKNGKSNENLKVTK